MPKMRFPCHYYRFTSIIAISLYAVYLMMTLSGNMPANEKQGGSSMDNYVDPRQDKHSDSAAFQMLAMWKMQRKPKIDMEFKHLQMEQRKTQVKKMCDHYKHQIENTFQHQHLFIDGYHNLSWCPVFKAASSSWFYNFLQLGCHKFKSCNTSESSFDLVLVDDLLQKLGRFQKGVGLAAKSRALFPPMEQTEAAMLLPKTLSFFIVRHPFERLLSTYRDKLEQFYGKQYFYFKYGRRIVETYRNKTGVCENETDPKCPPKTIRGFSAEDLPTFPEFINFILMSNVTDEHWQPFYDQCGVCSVNYDLVMKFETLYEDQWHLLYKLQLDRIISPKWRNANFRGLTSLHVAKKYYSQIPQSKIKQLYAKYQIDFHMFGYDANKYIQLGYKLI